MVPTMFTCVLVLLGMAAPAMSGMGANAMFDYYIHEANDMVRNMNKGTIDASSYVSLPSEASDPVLYDFTSLTRKGDVIVTETRNGGSSSVYVEVSAGLNNLVFQAHLRKKVLFITLTGGLRMHLTDNSFTIGVRMDFSSRGCTMGLEKVEAKLDGMYVDVWGMTQVGDNKVKGVIRNLYNANKASWENSIVSQIRDLFSQKVDYPDNPFCKEFLSTTRQMDILLESFTLNASVASIQTTNLSRKVICVKSHSDWSAGNATWWVVELNSKSGSSLVSQLDCSRTSRLKCFYGSNSI